MNLFKIKQTWQLRLAAVIGCAIVAIATLHPTSLSAQTASPQTVVNQFYQWFLTTESIQENFVQQQAAFTPELYDQLVTAWQKRPRADTKFVDFDVFSGTQVDMAKATVRSTIQTTPNSNAEVDIDLFEGRIRNGTRVQVSNTPIPIKVILEKKDSEPWRIRNIIYPRMSWDNLMSILQDINHTCP
jgi:Protein of unknown function (DUF3828)